MRGKHCLNLWGPVDGQGTNILVSLSSIQCFGAATCFRCFLGPRVMAELGTKRATSQCFYSPWIHPGNVASGQRECHICFCWGIVGISSSRKSWDRIHCERWWLSVLTRWWTQGPIIFWGKKCKFLTWHFLNTYQLYASQCRKRGIQPTTPVQQILKFNVLDWGKSIMVCSKV